MSNPSHGERELGAGDGGHGDRHDNTLALRLYLGSKGDANGWRS